MELPVEFVSCCVRGDMWGMVSAEGCSVPMLVMPESEALPALERA
jgi:hypothetical protein